MGPSHDHPADSGPPRRRHADDRPDERPPAWDPPPDHRQSHAHDADHPGHEERPPRADRHAYQDGPAPTPQHRYAPDRPSPDSTPPHRYAPDSSDRPGQDRPGPERDAEWRPAREDRRRGPGDRRPADPWAEHDPLGETPRAPRGPRPPRSRTHDGGDEPGVALDVDESTVIGRARVIGPGADTPSRPQPRTRPFGLGPIGRAVPGRLGGPTGPGGPGGPAGPGGSGPGGPGGRHTRGGEGGLPRGLSIRTRLGNRRKALSATAAVLIMLLGVGVLGGTYFLDSVKVSSELTFPSTTTVLYDDGSTLAKLGEVTRYEVPYDDMVDVAVKTIVASEDQTFWTNEGVDLGSVMRAAWNNFTGGDIQGASTITQQYARLAFDLDVNEVTYQRKAREAALAWKMSRTLDKEKILESYLNSVPFGRQTYGIEAGAQAFFGKTARKSAPAEQQITWAEAMVLVAMVKQPYPNPDDPVGQPGYDPTVSPEADANARQRFDYVRQQLVTMQYLSAEEAAALTFPDTVLAYKQDGNGLETPAGMVVNHALSELTHTKDSPFYGAKDWKFIREGGYQIHTTLNKGAQEAAVAAANGTVPNSPMAGQPDNLQAALVAVQPGTGRVLAYYGGPDGKGSDYAGFYYDENGEATGVGRHPPGSSFKVYTLAAALKAGFSLNSYWDWNPHDMQGRTGASQIQNASTCGNLRAGDKTPCSLLQSTVSSLNVPFYQVTLSVTQAKVMEMARDAGIDYMWTDDLERRDLRAVANMGTETPEKFDTILGIGQYSITVMDHANGLATMAAGGLRADAHFVSKVTKGNSTVYAERLPTDSNRIMSPQNINDLTYALSQVSSAKVNIGWDTAGKTGTWELAGSRTENAHAWMVGFSRRIAAAVWVGNKNTEQALRDKSNNIIYGAGVPAQIWQAFMTNATAAMNEPKDNTKFNRPNFAGTTNPPGSVAGPNTPGRRETTTPTRPNR